MNKRQKKKFEKKLCLKRYDTLSKLHKQGKMRLWVDGKYVTATMAMCSCGITKNNRIYPKSALMNAFKEIGMINDEVDNEHPTFSCRIVEGE